MANNHNNKYDPNTIYTSTQYLIDHDPELINQERKLMELTKDLSNTRSQNSMAFGYSINHQIFNKRKSKPILCISDFREIIDSLVLANINELPKQADEVKNFNKTLTKFTLNALLNNVIGNNINIKEYNLLLLNDNTRNINSIFGNNYNNDIKELGIMKYKNKTCTFNTKLENNTLYYTVRLQ